MINQFRRIAKDLIDAQQLTDVMFGTVVNAQPIEISVNQKLTLPAAFLVVPEHLTRYEIDARHAHEYGGGTTDDALPDKLLIRRGLDAGDKVILIRASGGGQYVVFGRVAE